MASAAKPVTLADDISVQHARLSYGALIALARKDSALFAEMILQDEETGDPITLNAMHEEWHRVANTGVNMVVWAHPESGKAVPTTTEIPTPKGWTTMGALGVGDTVFGPDGKPCTVNWVSPIQIGRTVYRVRFNDGDEVLADADHQWAAWNQDDRRAGRAKRVVTTREMAATVVRNGKNHWHIPITGPVQFEAQVLSVHPYVLGCWLGDGDSGGPRFTCHEEDREILDACVGYEGGFHGKPKRQGAELRVINMGIGVGWDSARRAHEKLGSRLRALGLLNNKQIPEAYLTASEAQRRDLLAGLLDTDGNAGPKNRVEFSNTNEKLARQTLELVRSLGYRAVIRGPLRSTVNGVEAEPHWRVTFTAHNQVFRLARKAAVLTPFDRGPRLTSRVVTAIEEVPSVPVKCIGVDSADNTYLMTRSFTVTHNSQNLAIARVLWLLGRNPRYRIAILAAAEKQAKKLVMSLRNHIANNAILHEIFPDLRRGDLWADNMFSVKRPGNIKDPSVQVISPNGEVQGARLDFLIIDDILVENNTRTAYQREKLSTWVKTSAFSRLSRNAQIIFLANAFHPEDMAHEMKEQGWWAKKYPVENDNGVPTWPERWDAKRIAKQRTTMGPTEFARAMMCEARADGDARFKQEWIDACLERGTGYKLFRTLAAFVVWCGALFWRRHKVKWALGEVNQFPPGFLCFTGVDLAVSKRDAADPSVLFTVLLWPNGTRQVLEIQRGKWSSDEILKRIVDTHARYGSRFIVENNGAQDYLVQWLRIEHPEIKVKGFRTGTNKWSKDFGVESLAAEMAAEMWLIPCLEGPDGKRVIHENVRKWIQEMLYYSPGTHTGDCLMAAWFVREAIRAFASSNDDDDSGDVKVSVIGGN